MGITANKILRETTLWTMYTIDVTDGAAQNILRDSMALITETNPSAMRYQDELSSRILSIEDQRLLIDNEIKRLSPRWKIERMAVIDRNILRLGIWEIQQGKTPAIVIVNACIELAKTYSHKSSSAFINGLLDQFCKDHNISLSTSKA